MYYYRLREQTQEKITGTSEQTNNRDIIVREKVSQTVRNERTKDRSGREPKRFQSQRNSNFFRYRPPDLVLRIRRRDRSDELGRHFHVVVVVVLFLPGIAPEKKKKSPAGAQTEGETAGTVRKRPRERGLESRRHVDTKKDEIYEALPAIDAALRIAEGDAGGVGFRRFLEIVEDDVADEASTAARRTVRNGKSVSALLVTLLRLLPNTGIGTVLTGRYDHGPWQKTAVDTVGSADHHFYDAKGEEKEALDDGHSGRVTVRSGSESSGLVEGRVAIRMTTLVLGVKLMRDLVVVVDHFSDDGVLFEGKTEVSRSFGEVLAFDVVEREFESRFVKSVGVVGLTEVSGSSVVDQMTRATSLDDERQSRSRGFQSDVAEGFHGAGKEKDVGRRVSDREFVGSHPSREVRVGQIVDHVLARTGTDEETPKRNSPGVKTTYDVGENVGSLFFDEPADHADYHVVVGGADLLSKHTTSFARIELFRIVSSPPYLEIGTAVELILFRTQMSSHERCRHVKGLKKRVVVSNYGF